MSPSFSPAEAEFVTRQFIELAGSIDRADLAMTGLLSAYASIATNGSPQMLDSCTASLEQALHVLKDIARVRAALKH